MAEDKHHHTHLEIHALVDGGYVVREGRFEGGDKWDQQRWNFRVERAAFADLEDALRWLGLQMVKKSPDLGRRPSIEELLR